MRLTAQSGWMLALACAAAMWSCAEGQLPGSPTGLTSPGSRVGGGPLNDEYGDDYYDDDDGPVTDPATDPGSVPAPAPDAGPVPLAISILAQLGSDAFTPNPLPAAVGDMIVWTNSDTVMHHIVLADGTLIGDLAPGASSVPVPLNTPVTTYQCMIHPATVGGIGVAEVVEPPVEAPVPPPIDYY
jgi:plastocyanin